MLKRTMSLVVIVAALLGLTGLTPRATRAATSRLYVNAAATGANNGSSWANAYTSLQAALGAANPGAGDTVEIWVARGTYRPSASDRAASFTLKNRVAIYGGFAGTEIQRDQRNIAANATILSGDLLGNDNTNLVFYEPTRSENSKVVVKATSLDSTAILDGFRISGGHNASPPVNQGGPWSVSWGAGLLLESSSVVLKNLTIERNLASHGPGLYTAQGNPLMVNLRFIGNSATRDGGAFYSHSGQPKVYNTTFSANKASYFGGAVYNVGANLTLVNITSSGNQANQSNLMTPGGAFLAMDQNATVTIANSITWNDTLAHVSGGSVIDNAGGTLTVSYSIVQGGLASGTNIGTADPQFADAFTGNFTLLDTSPAIDAGTNGAVPADAGDIDLDGNTAELLPIDLAGGARFLDHILPDMGNGTAPIVDIGAYEIPAPVISTVSGQVTDGNGTPLANVVVSPVTIRGMEISQAIQDLNNTVPLVEDKPTMARVYPGTNGSQPISATVVLAATRNGSALAGSPLRIGRLASTSPSRASYHNSANFSLPASWLSGDVSFQASLDPASSVAMDVTDSNGMYSIELKAGTYTLTAEGAAGIVGTRSVTVGDQNQTVDFAPLDPGVHRVHLPLVIGGGSSPDVFNNRSAFTLSFVTMPDFDIKIVPINYTYNGKTYPGVQSSGVATLKAYLTARYPASEVSITMRAPVSMTYMSGALTSDMLNQLKQLKTSDGAPASQFYYGISEISDNVYDAAGRGFLFDRVAVGVGAGDFLAAHEMGHNMGLNHPCEDPNSPYRTNSQIGQYGLNLSTTPPEIHSPTSTTSIMLPGCNHVSGTNDWFSDYEYKKMHADQLADGLLLQPETDVLVIRATFGEGAPSLLPVYAIRAEPSPAPASSAYAVELLDASGRVIAAHPVAASSVDGAGKDQIISARIPSPAVPVAGIRLLRDGQALASRSLGPDRASTATLAKGAAPTISWAAANAPALVRVSGDGGATWQTLGLDVLGGQLQVAPAQLGKGALEIQVISGR